MLLARRKFLTGLGSVILAAPAVVHAKNLMPVRPLRISPVHVIDSVPVFEVKILARLQMENWLKIHSDLVMYGNAYVDEKDGFLHHIPFDKGLIGLAN